MNTVADQAPFGCAINVVTPMPSAKVDYNAKQAVVTFDPAKTTPEALTKATADAGFPLPVAQVR